MNISDLKEKIIDLYEREIKPRAILAFQKGQQAYRFGAKYNPIQYKHIIIAGWVFFATGVIVSYLFLYSISINYNEWYGEMPGFQQLENPDTELASELYTADSVLLGKYFRDNRTRVEYEKLSQNVLDALYATEDIRFFKHSGIDLKGTFAIAWYLLQGDKRGSSTITQQLAKNLFRTRGEKYSGELSSVKGLRTVVVKLKEWLTAAEIERRYTKEEIVTMYLNTVDFGSNAKGIEVASRTFFSKPQSELKIEEAAVLVGLLKAPTDYSPVYNYESSIDRRNVVLQQLKKYDFIKEEKAKMLTDSPIDTKYFVEGHNSGLAPYLRKIVADTLNKWCEKNHYDLYGDGLTVYTTVNSRMQRYAEQAVHAHMKEYQKLFFEHWEGRNPWTKEGEDGGFEEIEGFLYHRIKRTPHYRQLKEKFDGDSVKIMKVLQTPRKMEVFTWENDNYRKDTVLSPIDSLGYYYHFLHAGFISVDPRSGAVKAYVGGINHTNWQYDHVIQGKRQPGSTFKPIVYSSILGEAGNQYSPCYKVVDAPVTFYQEDAEEDEPKSWTPQNAGGEYTGDTMTLRQAMARSKNSITAYMMKIMGEQTPYLVRDYARKLGVTSHLEAVPAMCLGTFDISIYELVSVYSTFMNEGRYTKPYFISKIVDKYGNVIAEFKPKPKRVISEELAYVMTYMLRGATEEVGGTGRGLFRYGLLDHNNQIGAKTGTTQNYSDAWFMGVVPQLVSGVWTGGDHRSIHFRTIELGQGAKQSLPIWANYMKKVYADDSLDIERQKFPEPKVPINITIDCDLVKKDTLGIDTMDVADDTIELDLMQDSNDDPF